MAPTNPPSAPEPQQSAESQWAEAYAPVKRSKKTFLIWMWITIVLFLLFPLSYIFILIAFPSDKDVGQGFYLVYLWMLIFALFFISLIVTIVLGVNASSTRRRVEAALNAGQSQ